MRCDPWTVQITDRGGSEVLYQPAHQSLKYTPVVNASAVGSVTLAIGDAVSSRGCAEILRVVEPWEHEVRLYRGRYLAGVGPVRKVNGKAHSLDFSDLFAWMDKRIIDKDIHLSDDASTGFAQVVARALAPDPSPNMSVFTYPTGVHGINMVKGVDVRRAADVLRDMARTYLDFTMIGRTCYVGPAGVFPSTEDVATPLILHDDGVTDVDPVKDGDLLYTDMTVYASPTLPDGTPLAEPISGRSIADTDTFGLVQGSVTELNIRNAQAAVLNAKARVKAMLPAPRTVKVTLSPDAAFEYEELFPGRLFDCRLDRSSPFPIMQMMRLTTFDVTDGDSEDIVLNLVPLGELPSA